MATINATNNTQVLTGINDVNGNEIIKITATASAVNEFTLTNAATGNYPILSATGGDANIGMIFRPKGTGYFTFEGNVLSTGIFHTIGQGSSVADVRLSLAEGRTGDGNTIIDLIADATNTLYATRILRSSGINGVFSLENKGTGGIVISCETGGKISIPTPINYAVDNESTDSYVIALSPVIYAYTAGMQIIFKAKTANTSGATIDVNGLGAKTIVKGVSTALASNDILAGMYCLLIYDGTNFVLMNPRAL